MPYYIYKVFRKPFLRLDQVGQHEGYRAASERAKMLRKELELTASCEVRIVFAENELGAEDMLSRVREPLPELGDD